MSRALFGAHVRGRPHRHAGDRETLRLHDLGDTEIRDDGPAILVQHDIGRLDIAVNDAVAVGVPERVTNLGQDGLHHRDRQRADLVDDRVESPPLDVLHDEVQDLLALLDGVNGDDVRMTQRCGRARLALEPLDHPLAHQQ